MLHQQQELAVKPKQQLKGAWSLTILCDNNICMGTSILVDMFNSLLNAVHHLNAALQVPIFCAQRFHF